MLAKKYFIRVFGCQMNVADSERIAGWYEQRGWKKAERVEEAEEVVIVSCSVRQTAEDRVCGLVNNLVKIKDQRSSRSAAKIKDRNENLKLDRPRIVLTGCMLRYPLRWLREKLPQVDEFKRISEYSLNTKFVIHNTSSAALVPIMEGCNNFCSYCVVPYARGREISRSMEEIVCEVEELVKRGDKEITLLGQNVNSYGKDFGPKETSLALSHFNDIYHFSGKNLFALLLTVLHQISGIEKISFLTSNPWDLSDDIIEAMRLPKIDRYLHLPVQSGDDEILRKMNRKYTVADYIKLVEKIRKRIPDIKIGTDIIVGFPSETQNQFQHTVDLCEKLGFEKAYVAMYSPRLQTVAYKLKDDVPHEEKRRRWKILDEMINPKNAT